MNKSLPVVGWCEWVELPEFKVEAVKAKVDTGAKTCAIHAYFVEPYEKEGQTWVKFGLHPNQDSLEESVECHAPLADRRKVTDSGGHTEERFVICTKVQVGEQLFEAEMTLTNRDSMRFRMLLGRNALNTRFVVNPAEAFLQGHKPELEKNLDEDSNSFEE